MSVEPPGLFQESGRTCPKCQLPRPLSDFHRRGEGGKRRRVCGPCRAAARGVRATAPETKLRHNLKSLYGITLEQYRAMLGAQLGVCAICGMPPAKNRRLVVDHCHASGKVRGLLCGPCNTQLGSYEKLRGLAPAYLAKYGAGNPLLSHAAESAAQP